MITIACQCGLALRTSGPHDEVDYLLGERSDMYPDKYPCPREGCTGHMALFDVVESVSLRDLEIVDVTVQEAFAALKGLGLPKERDCGETAVRQALVGARIEKVDVQQLRGTNRSVVYSIGLEGGVTLYLASSPQGAIVYRIAGKRNYTKEVSDGAVRSDPPQL